jgi:ribosomal protein S18 acetylase RimI-like enzyme
LSSQSATELGLLQRLRQKIRYRLLIQEILARLAGIGIQIQPYYLVLEGLFGGSNPEWESGFDEFSIGFLSNPDMKHVAALSGRPASEDKLLLRLKDGMKCFAVQQQGQVIGYTWCDFKECNFVGHRFPLRENEAYLFDAYTSRSFRGRNIAPYMRYQCYKELAKTGRVRLYSITLLFNTSSKKFKQKLNAKPLKLGLFVELFKRWHFDLLVREYKIES